MVAWLGRRAALPRDTLLKQGTTLKFSEEHGAAFCESNNTVVPPRVARRRLVPVVRDAKSPRRSKKFLAVYFNFI